MAELVKKHLIRPFINSSETGTPNWVQIKKSTDFTRSMNPVTEERDYISDEQPTTELTGYKPSEGLTVTMYKGEEDFDLFYSLYKKKAVGDEAKREYMLVYIFDSVEDDDETYYFAEKTNCTITVDELNSTGSTLTITVYENGTPIQGYCTLSAGGVPSFTEGEMPTV